MSEVTVESVNKDFENVNALKDLTFRVEKNTMYGLIGPDGAGKTTFMRIAVCLLMQTSGSISVGGYDTFKFPLNVKQIVGYMPQEFSLYSDLTVGENMKFFAELFGIGDKERLKRIERLLEFSKLGPFIKRRAGNLSGGMKKKLALSCTLIHTPEVLFLDEPTTGVDPVSRREFWEILSEVKNEGATIIVSTPYMDEAEKCDRVGFILNGSIISEGTPAELQIRYKNEMIAVRGIDIVRKARNLKYPSEILNVKAFGDRLHLTVKNADNTMGKITEFFDRNGIVDIRAEKVSPSMEDVFVESMEHGL